MQRRTVRRHLAGLTTLAMSAAAPLTLAPGLASAATQAPADHTLAPNTRFYVPPPAQGSVQQILQLVKSGQLKNAGLHHRHGVGAVRGLARRRDRRAGSRARQPGLAAGRRRRRAAGPADPGRRQAGSTPSRSSSPTTFPGVTARSTRPAARRPTPPTMPGSTPSAAPWATPRQWCSRSPTRWRTFRVLRLRVRDRFPGHHQHHPDRRHPLRGDHAGERPEHQPLPRRREQRLAERRRHGPDADRRRRPADAGLLPQRLQLPVRHQQRLLRHLGVRVHRLRDRERGADPG